MSGLETASTPATRRDLLGASRSGVADLPVDVGRTVDAKRLLRVLVADDDAMLGMVLAAMLEEMGHEVCAVEGTEGEAVAAAFRYRPDLMIVDVRLGRDSGITMIDKIRLSWFVAHVFISGDVSGVRAARPNSIYVQKPFREMELALAIGRALACADPNRAA